MPGIFTLFSKSHSLKTGAIVIGVFSILSKLLGLFRYSLIASRFGTGVVADSYMAAFRIPDFIYNAVVFGALSVAFIPVFLDLYEKGKKREDQPRDLSVEPTEEGIGSVNVDFQAQIASLFSIPFKAFKKRSITKESFFELHFELINAMLTILSLSITRVAVIAWIFASSIVPRLVPGFSSESVALTISMTRVMLLSPIIFCVSNIIGSVLQAFQRFTFFALAPVCYNLGIIFGILVLYPLLGPIGLAWRVVVFYNAYDLETLPVSFIAVSLAVASFPVLGGLFAQKKYDDFRRVFRSSLEHILRIMVPLMFFLILLRAQAVRLTLGYGLYNWADTVRTLQIFAILSASLIPQSVIPLFARALYAREKTAAPVITSLIAIGTNIASAFLLTPFYGLAGLALAFSASSFLHAFILAVLAEREIHGSLFCREFLISVLRFSIAAIFSGIMLYTALHIAAALIGTSHVWSLSLQTLIAFSIGSGSYVLLLWIFGDRVVNTIIKKRLGL